MRFEPVTSANTGAMLYQLSYEATHWERGQFIWFISPYLPIILHFHLQQSSNMKYIPLLIYTSHQWYQPCIVFADTRTFVY